jgi:hypothetical protein
MMRIKMIIIIMMITVLILYCHSLETNLIILFILLQMIYQFLLIFEYLGASHSILQNSRATFYAYDHFHGEQSLSIITPGKILVYSQGWCCCCAARSVRICIIYIERKLGYGVVHSMDRLRIMNRFFVLKFKSSI